MTIEQETPDPDAVMDQLQKMFSFYRESEDLLNTVMATFSLPANIELLQSFEAGQKLQVILNKWRATYDDIRSRYRS